MFLCFLVSPCFLSDDNVAGITLLALGNGGPDIAYVACFSPVSYLLVDLCSRFLLCFSVTVASVLSGNFPLAISSLVGASVFITSVVVGSIILIAPLEKMHVMKINFLRDLLAYLLTTTVILIITADGLVSTEQLLFTLVSFPLPFFSTV